MTSTRNSAPHALRRRLTQEQVHLLQAALLQGEPALDAWRAWKTGTDIETLDSGSFRLLPQLHHNLEAHDVHDPLMTTLRGVYRRAWYTNQLLLHHVASIATVLNQHDIPVLALNGTGLLLNHYETYGLRPLDGIDLMVRPEQAAQAVALFQEHGWTPTTCYPQRRLAAHQACAFKDDAGLLSFLHTHVPGDGTPKDLDVPCWDHAVLTSLQDTTLYTLAPTEHLLHVCIHGLQDDATTLLCGLADALTLLHASPDIDWARMLGLVEAHRIVVPVRTALTYLHETLDAPIPPDVLQDLSERSVSRSERTEYALRTWAPNLVRALCMPWLLHRYYARLRPLAETKPNTLSFPRYLQFRWQVDHLWQLPGHLVVKTLRHLRRAPQASPHGSP